MKNLSLRVVFTSSLFLLLSFYIFPFFEDFSLYEVSLEITERGADSDILVFTILSLVFVLLNFICASITLFKDNTNNRIVILFLSILAFIVYVLYSRILPDGVDLSYGAYIITIAILTLLISAIGSVFCKNSHPEKSPSKHKAPFIICIIVLSLVAFVVIRDFRQLHLKNKIIEQERIHNEQAEEYAISHPLTDVMENMDGYVFMSEILSQKEVRERIINQYSQKFYDMLPKDMQSTRYAYDRDNQYWHCKGEEDSLWVEFGYYPYSDAIYVTYSVNDLFIARDGSYELGDHELSYPIDESSSEYREYLENLRADNKEKRLKEEAHKAYMYSLTLGPAFDLFDQTPVDLKDIITHPDVKKRITEQYSKRFYELLKIWEVAEGTQFSAMSREVHALTAMASNNSTQSFVKLHYLEGADKLDVELKINGVDIDSEGDYDIGLWKLDYYTNEFGEDIKSDPYVIMNFHPDEASSHRSDQDDRMYIRISNNDGVIIFYIQDYGGIVNNFYSGTALTIRRDSDGEIYKFPLTPDSNKSEYLHLDNSQYRLFFELLDRGGITMSYKYYGDRSAVFRINKETTKAYSAVALLCTY